MNRLFTLLLAASCLTAVGQVTYPYNPDGNADSAIGVSDIQDLLTVYGSPFSPSEITVGDTALSDWIYLLDSSLTSLQSEVSPIVFGERQLIQLDSLQWTEIQSPNRLVTELALGRDGLLILGTNCYGSSRPVELFVHQEGIVPCGESIFDCEDAQINSFFEAVEFSDYQYSATGLTVAIRASEKVVFRQDNSSDDCVNQTIWWIPFETNSLSIGHTAWRCGDLVSYEGHDYQTISAGGRCWFAESLKYLPEVHEWSNQSSNEPRFYLRDYSGTSVEAARNESGFDTVGVYYNWTATAMNLCPTGWSVPLLDDWLRLLPVFSSSLEPNLYGTGSYLVDEDDWPEPDLIPHGKPYDLWQLKLKPNGRFTGDFSGEFWENVGIGFYQNIPPNGMLGIGAWDLNIDVFGSYGYSNTIRCIKDAE